jgi:PAS domain S-box-containing protein
MWITMEDGKKTKSELLDELRPLRERVFELESEQINTKLIIENNPDAILLTSPDGNIYPANSAACKLFDMTEEEICTKGRNGIVDINDRRLPELLEEDNRTGRVNGF